MWAHLNRFKVPALRSLAVDPPYMHDGSAATLETVVAFHDERFAMQLIAEETVAQVAFLSAL